jgi:hypothetical protein
VAGLRDMLDRFRRAGTPGPAGRAGVPVDRAAERAAELEPVLALLAPTIAECEWIRTHAAAEADQIRDQAVAQAANLVATAREQAAGVRAEAAARARRHGDAESAGLAAEAARQADAVRARADARMPDCVARVVGLVGEIAETGQGPAATPERLR